MKKHILYLLIILLFSSTVSCTCDDDFEDFYNGDWSYKLSDEYAIEHINYKEVILCSINRKHNVASTIILDEHIVMFCHNDRIALLKTLVNGENYYHHFNIHTGELKRNLTPEEINGIIVNEKTCAWIRTDGVPEGAVFE
ncbi:MAG: hypothetical protein IJB49_02055 [Clostridia bacterium]|nr:hypothetical protein [Clostridia bacterium]